MKYFTKAQIEEIRRALATEGVKDTDLDNAHALSGDEQVAIVQDGVNKKVGVRKLIHDYLPDDIADGADGKSAYEIWLDAGNTGTEADFLASLKGEKGATGATGATGQRGMDGARGPQGAKGDKGDKGDPGSGTEVAWNQINTTGSKIAEITINGTKTDVRAPEGGGSTPSSIDLDDYVQVRYSSVKTNPGTPSTNQGNWHETKGSSDVWMAQRFRDTTSSSWSPWSITDISRVVPIYATLESFIFTRNDAATVTAPTGGSYNNPSSVTSTDTSVWSDGVPTGSAKIWFTHRTFATDSTYDDPAWATPAVLADTVDMDYEYSSTANPGTRGEPAKTGPHATETNPYWSDSADDSTIWMAMRKITGDIYEPGSSWRIVKIKGEKGSDGTSVTPLGSVFGVFDSVGAAQTYYNSHSDLKSPHYAICKDTGSTTYDVLYKFTRTGTNTSTYSDETSNVTTGDFYLDPDGNMWVYDGDDFNNAGVIRGEKGEPGDTPILHIKYANYDAENDVFVFTEGGSGSEDDGEEPGDYIGMYADYSPYDSNDPDDYVPWKYVKGQDGFGYEYIFYLENSGSAPLLPALSPNEDNYVPTADGWTDDPGGVSASNRYCWEAWRKKTNGVWSEWYGTAGGYARLYAFYAEDGRDGTDGVDGKDALPLRVRNWSEVDRTATGATALTGDDKIFSGYEANAPFRDIILITEQDYVSGYPFVQDDKGMPMALIINYDPDGHSGGFDGTDIALPVGGANPNYTNTIPTSAATSEALYDDNIMWCIFMNMGALFVNLLLANQAYINDLTVKKLNTAGEGEGATNEKIIIYGNNMTVYDSGKKMRVNITADEIDLSPTSIPYPMGTGSLVSLSKTIKFTSGSGSGTLRLIIGEFSVSNNSSSISYPAFYANIVSGATSSSTATITSVWSGILTNSAMPVKEVDFTGTLSNDLYSVSAGTDTLNSGDYLVAIDINYSYSVSQSGTALFTIDADPLDLGISGYTSLGSVMVVDTSENYVKIGKNGVIINLGGGFYASFETDPNNATPAYRRKIALMGASSGTEFGIRLTGNGIEKKNLSDNSWTLL